MSSDLPIKCNVSIILPLLIFLKIPFGIDSLAICMQDLEKELPPNLFWADVFPTKVKKGYQMLVQLSHASREWLTIV